MPQEQDILSIGFDYKKAQKEAELVRKEIQSIIDLGDKFAANYSKIDISGGFATSKKASEDVNKTLAEGNTIVENYNKGLSSLSSTSKNVEDAQKRLNEATKKYDDTVKNSASTTKQVNAANREVIQTQKQLSDALTINDKSQQRINKTQKERLADAQKAGTISAKEAKMIEQASNEYLQLSKSLQDAELKYKNLALTQGFEHEQTQVALKDALAIRSTLDKVDTALGNYQRRVGQYGTAFNGLGASIQQILREAPSAAVSLSTFFLAISNNLPTFFDEIEKIKEEQKAANIATQEAAVLAKEQAIATAISAGATQEAALAEGLLAEKTVLANAAATAAPGLLKRITSSLFSLQSGLTLGVLLLTLFGSELFAAVGSMVKGTKSTLDFQKAQEDLAAEFKETNGSITENIVKLDILNDRIKAGGKSFEERQEILKDYNKEFGDTLGVAKSYNEVEQILRDKTGAYIQAMLLRAKAQAALNLAIKEQEKILEENADAEQQVQARRNGLLKNRSKYNADYQKIIEKETNLSIKQRNDRRDIENKTAEDRKKYFEKEYESLQLQADVLDKVNKMDSDKTDDKKDKKVKEVKTISDAVKELRKELATIDKQQVTGLLGDTDADLERVKAYQKAFEDIFNRGGNERTPIVQKLLTELDPVSQRLLEDQIHDLTEKLKKDSKADKIEIPVDGKKFLDEQTKVYEESLNRDQLALDRDYALRRQKLLVQYDFGNITKKQYEKGLLDIQEDYANKAIEVQIDQYKAALKYAFVGVKETQENADKKLEIEKKLAQLRSQLGEQVNKQDQENLKKRREDLVNFLEGVKSAFGQIADVLGGVVNIDVTKQKNDLQDMEDMQEKNYENEIERIRNSSDTEEEKANRLKVLEASRQAQKEENDRKNREIQQEQAGFDKQIAIMNIILNTAVSIAKSLANPFQLGAAIALGAAQLAVAIATPIPKFAAGVKNKKESGFGIVGEAGPELVNIKGQAPLLVQKETLMYLPKGTDVINEVMYRSMARQNVGEIDKKSDRSEGLLMELIKETRKNNGKEVRLNQKIILDTAWKDYTNDYYGRKRKN